MGDVYCFGHVSAGKVYRIRGESPEANGYVCTSSPGVVNSPTLPEVEAFLGQGDTRRNSSSQGGELRMVSPKPPETPNPCRHRGAVAVPFGPWNSRI